MKPIMQQSSFKSDVDFDCPFCSAKCSADATSCAVLHAMPMCKKFEELGPTEFLNAVNTAVANRRGVGLA